LFSNLKEQKSSARLQKTEVREGQVSSFLNASFSLFVSKTRVSALPKNRKSENMEVQTDTIFAADFSLKKL